MYLSTSTSTEDFPELYLSIFQALYKFYLSTDVMYLSTKYSCPVLSKSHSLALRPVGDVVLNPSLRKSKHYLRHRMQADAICSF